MTTTINAVLPVLDKLADIPADRNRTKREIAKRNTQRDTVLGVAAAATAIVCMFLAADEWRHHRRLEHLRKVLDGAAQTGDEARAARALEQLLRQLERDGLPREVYATAEPAVQAAVQRFPSLLTSLMKAEGALIPGEIAA